MNSSLLRFITAGSVDDGKSTLIGRLLYDSKSLLSDQIAKLQDSSQNGEAPDFAGLTDGLMAEREQGITIDVAYRYFSTPKRKFIIADTPGHEQYTRNMVTGASTADAAIILIDATRIDFSGSQPALLPQTKRHSAILKLLGTQHIIIAVNKLDLLAFNQNTYESIVVAYQQLAKQLQLTATLHYIPISALGGDNIVNRSQHTDWYHGEPLLSILENLPTVQHQYQQQAAHFPVQRVARQDGSSTDDFRGYQGKLEAGTLTVGDTIKALPSEQTANIRAIYGTHGQQTSAQAGEVLTITLDRDIDISRGDAIVAIDNPLQAKKHLQAALCWFDNQPLNSARRYLLKHTTHTTIAKIKAIHYVWDIHTLSKTTAADTLNLNDIGNVSISLQQSLNATSYQHNHATGAFILIDESTNHTVAAGMIYGEDSPNEFTI